MSDRIFFERSFRTSSCQDPKKGGDSAVLSGESKAPEEGEKGYPMRILRDKYNEAVVIYITEHP